MNKKGFTLVELLAVIVLLSLIITIVTTNGFGAFNKTKSKITDEAKEEIIEGAKVFLTDVEFCDENINEDILDKLDIEDEDGDGEKCDQLQELEGYSLKVGILNELGYVNSNAINDFLDVTITLNVNDKTVKFNE